MKTFYTWLIKQENRNDPVGDLATDINRDENLPKKKNKKSLLDHLYNSGACFDCIDAFEEAWIEYKGLIK